MRILIILFALTYGFIAKAQQNIIILIADDLGADYCGFTDNATDTANMPNIRSLLQKGVRFKNAWASPYCSSTRAGMLSGRYSFRTGVGTVIAGAGSADLDSAEISIPDMLKSFAPQSYACANIGKWHVNLQTPQKILYPTKKFSYDLYQGNFLGEIPDYYNWIRITNGVQTDTITTYATTQTIDDAIAWLDTLPNNKPFFLWLAFNAPHSPYHLPPANLHTVPGLTGTPQHINQNKKLYFKAMIEAMDSETGRLFQYLIAHNKMDSTNFIFMGDNGNDKRVSQIADSTHAKGTLYDYGVHVPFIAAGPAIINPNRSSDALINVQDVFASSLELAGFSNWAASIPAGTMIDSKSILPMLTNQNTSVRDWAFTELFTPTPTAGDGKSIRNLDYHLIKFDNGTQEFYKLSTDINEQNNLLLQNLSAVDLSNYTYLCNELSNLTGIPSCQNGVGVGILPESKPTLALSYNYPSISFSGQTAFTLCLYTADGKLLHQQAYAAGQYIVDVDKFTKGLYLAEINDRQTRKTIKFVAP